MGLSRDWQTAQPRISAEGGPDSDDIAQYNDMEDFKFFCFGFGSAVFFSFFLTLLPSHCREFIPIIQRKACEKGKKRKDELMREDTTQVTAGFERNLGRHVRDTDERKEKEEKGKKGRAELRLAYFVHSLHQLISPIPFPQVLLPMNVLSNFLCMCSYATKHHKPCFPSFGTEPSKQAKASNVGELKQQQQQQHSALSQTNYYVNVSHLVIVTRNG